MTVLLKTKVMTTNSIQTHKGPHLGMVAIVFMVLFITGLSFVISFSGGSHFPGPWEPAAAIVDYFQHHAQDVLMCAFFQFCSAIPLGIFTATAVSRINFLGSRTAGQLIALFGGFLTSVSIAVSALIIWVMAFPGIASDAATIRMLYYISFAIGGVGFSVPIGLLIAGIAVTSLFMRTLPRWLAVGGIVLAVIGELSCLSLLFPKLVYLIPLTRFPGFIWLIMAGFKLPSSPEFRPAGHAPGNY